MYLTVIAAKQKANREDAYNCSEIERHYRTSPNSFMFRFHPHLNVHNKLTPTSDSLSVSPKFLSI